MSKKATYPVLSSDEDKDVYSGKFTFEQGDMITAAAEAASNSRIGLLNMANARLYGGGFCSGARAQEEQLCHRSTLYPRLKADTHINPNLYPIAPGTALVTEDVDIFLDANFNQIQPSTVTVISAAAKHYDSEEEALDDPSLHQRMFQTWSAIFAAAKQAKIQTLIVSAIGGGAFHNPLECIADAFLRALKQAQFGDDLTHIRMIVFDDHNSRNNVARLQKTLKW
jgi:uncharacterized protein (TIGR02452 family)